MELTIEEKKRALKFFKSMKMESERNISEVKNLEKFNLGVDLINNSVFINSFSIEVSGGKFKKINRRNWEWQLIDYIHKLKVDHKVKFSSFIDRKLLEVEIKKLIDQDIVFPWHKIEVNKEGDFETGWVGFFRKIKNKAALKKDTRTLEEVEKDMVNDGCLIMGIEKSNDGKLYIDKSFIDNVNQVTQKWNNALKQGAKNAKNIKVVQTLDGEIHGNYFTSFSELFKMPFDGKIHYNFIGILNTLQNRTTKNGINYQLIKIEGTDQIRDFNIWKNMISLDKGGIYLFVVILSRKKNKYGDGYHTDVKFHRIKELKKMK